MRIVQISKLKLSNFKNEPLLFDFYLKEIYKSISLLEHEYPFFKEWYYEKVKNGILLDKRDIVFAMVDEHIAGVSIIKNDNDEKKLCTLRVSESFQKRGIGKSLIEDSLMALDTRYPLITVNSSKNYQFKRLFDYFGFKQVQCYKAYYISFLDEISYNGVLCEKNDKKNSFHKDNIYSNFNTVPITRGGIIESIKKTSLTSHFKLQDNYTPYHCSKCPKGKWTVSQP